jgi:hypothetical protein
VQEALHDRVLTLDDALAALEGVSADMIQELAGRLFRDPGLCLAVVAPHGTKAPDLEPALRLP